MLVAAFYFFISPAFIVVTTVNQEGFKKPGVSPFALSLHKKVSDNFAQWAEERVHKEKGEVISINNISGTEWPLFGSVFYLWSTEQIKNELIRTGSSYSMEYSQRSVEAAAALVADPKHAAWVKKHWGENYLHHQNVFYRMLLISGLTSHYNLTKNKKYFPLLKDQVLTLSKELDDSETGLLNDYPGECYPSVILAAIANIQRGSKALGIKKTEFVKKAARAFEKITDETGLPTYSANASFALPQGMARGNSNSFFLTFAPEAYPERSKKWFAQYEKYFWQEKFLAAGFREFPMDYNNERFIYMDVDAGPVIGGYGSAACAFGVAACRANGRFDLGYPLSAEMVAVSWPLPSGRLLIPSILSDASDAPLIGEIGVLFSLSMPPAKNLVVKEGGQGPAFVWILIGIYLFLGVLIVWKSSAKWKRREFFSTKFNHNSLLFLAVLMIIGFPVLLFTGYSFLALILILVTQYSVFR